MTFLSLVLVLIAGFPVTFSLAGVTGVFGAVDILTGHFNASSFSHDAPAPDGVDCFKPGSRPGKSQTGAGQIYFQNGGSETAGGAICPVSNCWIICALLRARYVLYAAMAKYSGLMPYVTSLTSSNSPNG